METPTIVNSSNTSIAYCTSDIFNTGVMGTTGAQGQIGSITLNTLNGFILNGGNMPRRLVKVMIVDPNENVPLDQCILYMGDDKITDATDQELFFELDIKDMLDKHNEKRITYKDKRVRDRDVYLEPAKLRDLKMVVTSGASF